MQQFYMASILGNEQCFTGRGVKGMLRVCKPLM